MNTNLDFLFSARTSAFRAIRRKGEFRYIASQKRGGLKALCRFAPPTKPLPRFYLGLLGLANFYIPFAVESIGISEVFLDQAAEHLGIPTERIGIYVGELNERRKLVIIDVEGESQWVLKMAVGHRADVAIRSETDGLRQALCDGQWAFGIPEMRKIEPIFGREAILIERIKGRQLTPAEFEESFLKKGIGHWVLGEGSFKYMEGTDSLSMAEWLDQNLTPHDQSLIAHIAACRDIGALLLQSPLGVVHGDFSPWNIIRRRTADICPPSSGFCAIDWEFSRANTPILFDYAYAAWCYTELLGRPIQGIGKQLQAQLVALGALWREIRGTGSSQ